MQSKIINKDFLQPSFNCIECSTFAQHTWKDFLLNRQPVGWMGTESYTNVNPKTGKENLFSLCISKCTLCEHESVWCDGKLVFPMSGSAPPPNSDLPQSVQNDYLEARSIADVSPRGAAALLRLCVEQICANEGITKGKLDKKIVELVELKNLNDDVVKALHFTRCIGNSSVHAGELTEGDDAGIVNKLFLLINFSAQHIYSLPKLSRESFSDLTEGEQKHVKEIHKENN